MMVDGCWTAKKWYGKVLEVPLTAFVDVRPEVFEISGLGFPKNAGGLELCQAFIYITNFNFLAQFREEMSVEQSQKIEKKNAQKIHFFGAVRGSMGMKS